MAFYVYFMASARNGTLYIGHTDDLPRRIREHKTHAFPKSFTARYNTVLLMCYEEYATRAEAVARENALKKWSRPRKLKRIESLNPTWQDLAADWQSGEYKPAYNPANFHITDDENI